MVTNTTAWNLFKHLVGIENPANGDANIIIDEDDKHKAPVIVGFLSPTHITLYNTRYAFKFDGKDWIGVDPKPYEGWI